MRYITLLFISIMFALPNIASAQPAPPPPGGGTLPPAQQQPGPGGGAGTTDMSSIIRALLNLLNAIVPLLIALAIVLFFWGLAKFILAAGDTAARASGINLMIWGVVALFVMVSLWGLVAVLQNTVGVDAGGAITPTVQFVN